MAARGCTEVETAALEGIVQMIDNIKINGLCGYTKRKAEKRVEWRMLSLQ